MRPTIAAEELRRNITQYLTTTFALDDEETREALERFFTDPVTGIFRGPYLRIRTPFRRAQGDWQESLDWAPAGFRPYRHQEKAFARLSTRNGPALPTLITTGTGSGKTESFLLPILNHCARARRAGRSGVRAILLYPMNALANDQAKRVDDYLADPALAGVSAGLYIGDVPADSGFQRVLVHRAEIRRSRPDILITNYKMLDLLLQRADDVPLWEDADPAYVVVDEFHTYDGAQGTDVAMLLRRMATALNLAEPGRPLGRMCPVATSATLADADDPVSREHLREVAGQVFATAFPDEAIIGEDRQDVEEFVRNDSLDYGLPVPTPHELAALPDPAHDTGAMHAIAEAVLGEPVVDPAELGDRLRRHILTSAVLAVLADRPAGTEEMLARLPRNGASGWGMTIRTHPEVAATALARFVALLSYARDPEDGTRPLVTVEAHLWIRAVNRLMREVSDIPAFLWSDEHPEPRSGGNTVPAETDQPVPALPPPHQHGAYLPAIYCRHCGRSGWMAISPEPTPTELITNPERIYRARFTGDRRRSRPMIHATPAERDQATAATQLHQLDPAGDRLHPLHPTDSSGSSGPDSGSTSRGSVAVLADLRSDRAADDAAADDVCPACTMRGGILFLGAGVASLASVAITGLFTGGELPPEERKTLLFSDSVQDAAHRAGFVADRAYTFSLRALLAARLGKEPRALNDLLGDVLAAATEEENALVAVVPPDLHGQDGVAALLAGDTASQRTWDQVGERLAFATVCEFGLRSRQGRTLELTRTAAVEVAVPDPHGVAELARDVHRRLPGDILTGMEEFPDLGRYGTFVRGVLQRMRTSGAVKHHWLDPYVHNGGVRRWLIWGGRPAGMPAFPSGVSAPTFLLSRSRTRTSFDVPAVPNSWYVDWAVRCLGIPRPAAPAYLAALLPALASAGVIATHTAEGDVQVFGLLPGHVHVRMLEDAELDDAALRCDTCRRVQPVFPERRAEWADRACPRFRCPGTLRADTGRRDFTLDYYRQLYQGAGPYQVIAAEHTGVLGRRRREEVEAAFRQRTRPTDPNVLSATPTLELGIDIGDLSAVILASLPRRPANYTQRVGRAGRRTGNSLLLTLVGRGQREQYYLADPLEMIAGEIAPPGCYLAAAELLRRQYLAHLVDLAARGRLPGALPLPRRTSQLFGPTGWLADLVAATAERSSDLADRFLAQFGPPADADTKHSHAELRRFADTGLAERVAEADAAFTRRMDDLRATVRSIDEALTNLVVADKEDARLEGELRAERRDVLRRIGALSVRADAHSTMVEQGLLPNYTLHDTRVTLDATLYWQNAGPDGSGEYESEQRRYERPGEFAIRELAPGNTFYADGYKHKVTGLDIGTESRPLWATWRLCPDCGYVRTRNARTDVSACPRCRSTEIADQGCLRGVLELREVTARTRREDARVSDDSDDRDRTYYEVAVTVDIDPATLAPDAWRHETATFGVDFTREAVIRQLNVGRKRYDAASYTEIAGLAVHVTGFGVCPRCGYATTDDQGAAHATDPLSYRGSGTDRHRPWCPRRRDQRPGDERRLLLAHELRTEAIRVLLPAVTIMVDERRASFAGALRAGIAAYYRGDPEHIRHTTASMPDPDTGSRRWFLVLYDSLPGGTGYLHRLSTPEAFRTVLEAARKVVRNCQCQHQGRPACHRCLLRYLPPEDHPLASRQEALNVIDDLLGSPGEDSGFAVRPVEDTTAIPLAQQVDSELERQFVRQVEAWCEDPRTPGHLTHETDVDGRRTRQLRVDTPDRRHVTHWRVELQHNLTDQIPDVMFTRLDGPQQEVALYLDGYRYHASPDANQIAGDATKRWRLRSDGTMVFQLTWDDVTGWGRRPDRDTAAWPYGGTAQEQARRYLRGLGRRGEELDELVWANPMQTLLAFLGDPDRAPWQARAEALLAGLLAHNPTARTQADATANDVPGVLRAAVRGEPLPSVPHGRTGVVRATDNQDCPVVLAVDRRGGTATFTGFAVLDDSAATIEADEVAHRRRWAAWLRWGDLLQFLDGGQLATTDPDLLDPTTLPIAADAGARSDRGLAGVDGVSFVPEDRRWREVLDLLDNSQPGLLRLASELASRGVRPPEVGYELADGWVLEMAWPDERVCVTVELNGSSAAQEQRDRDAALADAGWTARTATAWSLDSLVRLLPADSGRGEE